LNHDDLLLNPAGDLLDIEEPNGGIRIAGAEGSDVGDRDDFGVIHRSARDHRGGQEKREKGQSIPEELHGFTAGERRR